MVNGSNKRKENVVNEKTDSVPEIGLAWQSDKGPKKIIAISAGKAFVQTGDQTSFHEIISLADIPERIALEEKQAASHAKMQAVVTARHQQETAIEKERLSIGGFGDTLSPKARGVAIRTLNRQMLHDGEPSTQKEIVERMVSNGATIGTVQGKPVLELPNDTFLFQKDLSKYAMRYAEFLIEKSKEKIS